MLAILTRRATGTGAFVGLLAGMSSVASVAFFRPDISFLWHNVIGAVVVFTVGLSLSLSTGVQKIRSLKPLALSSEPTTRGVCRVMMGDGDRSLEMNLREELSRAAIHRNDRLLRAQVRPLVEYLRGRSPRLDLPLDVRATAFQRRVWRQLQAIPYGETRTYREVAAAIGRPTATRAVARACATNPDGAVHSMPPRHPDRRFPARISLGGGAKGEIAAAGASTSRPVDLSDFRLSTRMGPPWPKHTTEPATGRTAFPRPGDHPIHGTAAACRSRSPSSAAGRLVARPRMCLRRPASTSRCSSRDVSRTRRRAVQPASSYMSPSRSFTSWRSSMACVMRVTSIRSPGAARSNTCRR